MKEIRASSAEAEDLILAGVDDDDLKATVRALRGMKANLLRELGAGHEPQEESEG